MPTQSEKLPDQLTTAVDTRPGGGRKVTKVTAVSNLGRKLGLAIFGLTGLILTRQPIFIGDGEQHGETRVGTDAFVRPRSKASASAR